MNYTTANARALHQQLPTFTASTGITLAISFKVISDISGKYSYIEYIALDSLTTTSQFIIYITILEYFNKF